MAAASQATLQAAVAVLQSNGPAQDVVAQMLALVESMGSRCVCKMEVVEAAQQLHACMLPGDTSLPHIL